MKKLTYAQMDKVLSSLEFSMRVVTVENKLRVYEHEDTGAFLVLAFRPDTDAMLPHLIAAAQCTLKVPAIADPLDFAVELQKVELRAIREPGAGVFEPFLTGSCFSQ